VANQIGAQMVGVIGQLGIRFGRRKSRKETRSA
jgi:hypothetical protein